MSEKREKRPLHVPTAAFEFTYKNQHYEWDSYASFQTDYANYGQGISDEKLHFFLSRNFDINLSTLGNIFKNNLFHLDIDSVLYQLYDATVDAKKVMNDLLVLCEFGKYSLVHPKFQLIVVTIMKYYLDDSIKKTDLQKKIIILSLKILGVHEKHFYIQKLLTSIGKVKTIKENPWFHLSVVSTIST